SRELVGDLGLPLRWVGLVGGVGPVELEARAPPFAGHLLRQVALLDPPLERAVRSFELVVGAGVDEARVAAGRQYAGTDAAVRGGRPGDRYPGFHLQLSGRVEQAVAEEGRANRRDAALAEPAEQLGENLISERPDLVH